MDGSSAITNTGTAQTATQNPQDIGTQSLIPTMANLQPGADYSGSNLNTSSSTAIAIPLDSIKTGSVKAVQVVKPEYSYTPLMIGFGAAIIVAAVIAMIASNIIAERRLAID